MRQMQPQQTGRGGGQMARGAERFAQSRKELEEQLAESARIAAQIREKLAMVVGEIEMADR